MNNPKVSVLIPIYGVEQYIERCARSLFRQTMKEGIEFIFVNDATKDNSVNILKSVIDEFPERKEQIKIIHHPQNKGLAVARVTGVKAAEGDYVIHCDSDDWVEPNMFESLYSKALETNADIVVCDYVSEYNADEIDNDNLIRTEQTKLSSREEIASSMLRFEEMHPFLWIRLIKRDFYLKNEFFADPNITFCEDLAVTIPMHLSTDKVELVSLPLYHYNVVNSGSMTHEKSIKKIQSCKLAMDQLESYIRKNGFDSVIPSLEYRRFLYFIPLITCLESYDPIWWLALDNPSVKIKLMARSRISVWLIRHKLFKINKLLQIIVRIAFNR